VEYNIISVLFRSIFEISIHIPLPSRFQIRLDFPSSSTSSNTIESMSVVEGWSSNILRGHTTAGKILHIILYIKLAYIICIAFCVCVCVWFFLRRINNKRS
jgi:hypothetical protein